MFEEALDELEARLDLPYPERALVVQEIGSELEAAYLAHRAQGLDEGLARRAALDELALDEAALDSLSEVHRTPVRRAIARLPPGPREWFDGLAAAVPLAFLIIYVVTEVPMLRFLKEGGPAVWVVLITGLLALLLELQRAVRWFVLRDHSVAALGLDTPTPLYLAATLLGVGLLGTAMGYHSVLTAWAAQRLTEPALRVALREPLIGVIVAAALASLIVIVHAASQAGLRAMRVPPSRRASPPAQGPR